ncbi:DUF4260 domain-containing protein [Bosea psychrotolerans]|uniref:Uncharacterized protein DUF4260 n=1 Tax=Bosea psychrotolerans TaxID=1871628 RepID=A0A2S4MFG8_9HYPH|nr:DUF4260 domain-containing protein [Bosea psychrotolerans]POR53375.1 uncharacterized protein DUF4260 [Bosea psychrotolerans]
MAMLMQGHVTGAPNLLLRLEGALLGGLSVWLFARTGVSWWVFAGLILAPDLAMLGYLSGPRLGSAIYNAAHCLIGPVLLGVAATASGSTMMLALALIWAAHVEFDRALGYGLKYATRFADTHLGVIGPARRTE